MLLAKAQMVQKQPTDLKKYHTTTHESFKNPKLPYRNREGQNRGVFGATEDTGVAKQNELKSPHCLDAYGSKVKNPTSNIQLMSK